MWLFLCLIAFSRIFLGVHTPQDIVVGAVVGVLVMVLTGRLLLWLEEHQEKRALIVAIGVAVALVAAIYAANKPYPMDYDANGELLVDGLKMANDTFKAVCWLSAFLIGWILERRYVGFSTEIPMRDRFYRLACGLLGYYVISLVINPLIKAVLVGFAGTVVTCFL
jgi:undecaprenyl-diphosphatase